MGLLHQTYTLTSILCSHDIEFLPSLLLSLPSSTRPSRASYTAGATRGSSDGKLCYLIVDEAQNLERNVLLTALTRIGENSKVVLTHDVAQRDNLRVGRYDGIGAVFNETFTRSPSAHVFWWAGDKGACMHKFEVGPAGSGRSITDCIDDLGVADPDGSWYDSFVVPVLGIKVEVLQVQLRVAQCHVCALGQVDPIVGAGT